MLVNSMGGEEPRKTTASAASAIAGGRYGNQGSASCVFVAMEAGMDRVMWLLCLFVDTVRHCAGDLEL